MVAHPVDVGARGRVGLARQDAAIGVDRHAVHVRQLHPLVGVGVHDEVPGVHLVGVYAGEQREVSRHHQPLDVVGVGGVARLRHGRVHAAHARVRLPVEPRQRAAGLERVELAVARHAQPVEAAHVLPPAQDLPHEALRGVERRAAGAPLRLGRLADLARQEQAAIHRGGEQRVEQRGLPLRHRVLVVAEPLEAALDEVAQRDPRLARGDRPVERVERAEMVRESLANQREHLLRRGVGHEAHRRRRQDLGRQRAAVLGVEVPLAADGLAALHEQPGFPPHLAVEELHPELLLVPGPPAEALEVAEEARVLADLDRQARRLLPALHVLQHAELARVRADDGRGAQPRRGAQHLAAEGVGVGLVVERDVLHPDAPRAQLGRKVPHGGEDKRDLLRVVRHVGALPHHLDHQHRVARRIEVGERGERMAALVAEDGAEDHAALTRARR